MTETSNVDERLNHTAKVYTRSVNTTTVNINIGFCNDTVYCLCGILEMCMYYSLTFFRFSCSKLFISILWGNFRFILSPR